MDYKKVNEFVIKLDKALADFKNGMPEPLIENVTVMFTPEEIGILNQTFYDAKEFNIQQRNREKLALQSKLHENVFWQVGAELMR